MGLVPAFKNKARQKAWELQHPWAAPLAQREAKKGTNRNAMLLNERVYVVSGRSKLRGICGAPKQEKNPLVPVWKGDQIVMVDRSIRSDEYKSHRANMKRDRNRRRNKLQKESRRRNRGR